LHPLQATPFGFAVGLFLLGHLMETHVGFLLVEIAFGICFACIFHIHCTLACSTIHLVLDTVTLFDLIVVIFVNTLALFELSIMGPSMQQFCVFVRKGISSRA